MSCINEVLYSISVRSGPFAADCAPTLVEVIDDMRRDILMIQLYSIQYMIIVAMAVYRCRLNCGLDLLPDGLFAVSGPLFEGMLILRKD